MRWKKGTNPFYVLLVLVGTAFCLTACAYGLMALRAMRPQTQFGQAQTPALLGGSAGGSATQPVNVPAGPRGPHQLMDYMERSGDRLLLIELAALTLATFLAIGTDGYWARRAESKVVTKSPADASPSPSETSSQEDLS